VSSLKAEWKVVSVMFDPREPDSKMWVNSTYQDTYRTALENLTSNGYDIYSIHTMQERVRDSHYNYFVITAVKYTP
jgi:hypothetical protein